MKTVKYNCDKCGKEVNNFVHRIPDLCSDCSQDFKIVVDDFLKQE